MSGASTGPLPPSAAGTNNSQTMFNQLQNSGQNPYYNQLAGTYQANADRTLNQALNTVDMRSGAAGMAGSSRAGIASGMAMRDVNTDLQSNLSNLAYQGYNQNIQNQLQMAQAADQTAMQKYGADLGYASNIHSANMGLEGTKYASDNSLKGSMYGADLGLQGQRYASDASREASMYGADKGLQGTQYASDASKAASMYGADKGLQGTQYASDRSLQGTQYAADASRQASMYGSDKSYAASVYGSDAARQASMYGADASKAASMYGSDAARQASMYGADKSYAANIYGTDMQGYLGQLNNATQMYGMDQNYAYNMGNVANNAAAIQNQYNLGMAGNNTMNNQILAQLLAGQQGSMNAGMQMAPGVQGMGGYQLNNAMAPLQALQYYAGALGQPTILGSGGSFGSGYGNASSNSMGMNLSGYGGIGASGGGGGGGGDILSLLRGLLGG